MPCPKFRVILLLTALLSAASERVLSQEYQIRHYTLDDGLPSSQIRDISQGPDGRMWFATRSGVAAYDGSEWSVFNLSHGLAWTDVFALHWDASGRLCSAGSVPPFRVFCMDQGEWTELFEVPESGGEGLPPRDKLAPDVSITSFAVIGTSEMRVAFGTDRGLLIQDGSQRRYLTRSEGLPDDRVNALAVHGGDLLVATPRGLAVLRGSQVTPTPLTEAFDETLPASSRGVWGLVQEEGGAGSSGRLWLLGRSWIGRYEDERFVLLSQQLPALPKEVRHLVIADRRGGVYFGSSEGLYHFHPHRNLLPIGRDKGLLAEGVTALFLDREDVLWVGSRHGLSKISDRRFATYNRRHGLLDDEVTAVLERRGGGIVLAHPRGLTFLEGALVRTLDLQPHSPTADRLDRIRDLAEDDRGHLWVPTRGLVKIAPAGELRWYGEAQGLSGAVHSVRYAGGRVWAATQEGLFTLSGPRFERVSKETGELAIRRIFAGRAGIYLATASGLHRISETGQQSWSCEGSSPCNSVFGFLEKGDGTLWVGTSAGLFRAEEGRLVEEDHPSIRHPVYFIVEDEEGRSWFGIDNGAFLWDAQKLIHFTVLDGLAGRETNRAAGLVDGAGRVWIGTERGATVFTRDRARPRRASPTVILSDLESGARRFPLAEGGILSYDDNDWVFRFRALSFIDEERVYISSLLEGFDTAWSSPQISPRQEIRYTNLPPGSYQLHVKARNAEGTWGPEAVSATFKIRRPYWRQTWFFVLAILLGGVVLYFADKLLDHARYSRRLEEEVRERVTQLRQVEVELAKAQKLEAVGILAGGIAHDFNNFLTVLMGNLSLLGLPGRSEKERAEDMKDAQNAIRRASKLTQQLLTFSRGGAPVRKTASIREVITESASFVLSGSRARYEIDLVEDLRAVDIDTGQIHQLLNNLLINAMQAMPDGGTIRIVGRNVNGPPSGLIADAESPYVAIHVIDEGIGISKEDQEKIFDPYFTTKKKGKGLGLASAYSIARRHDGLLSVESEPGRGSKLTLYLPASTSKLVEPEGFDLEPASGSGRVLVMDDEESIRRVVAAILEDLGYEAVSVVNGQDAVESYRESVREGRPFDAVIMDLTIPGGMGGQEAIRYLRAIDPDVRAIVVSGYANDPVLARYREFGFCSRLSKPFRTADLAEVLKEAVREPALSGSA